MSHTDYYTTMNGIRRTVSVNYGIISSLRPLPALSTTSGGATIDYGYPLGEYQTVSLGLNLSSVGCFHPFAVLQAIDWVSNMVILMKLAVVLQDKICKF